MSAQGIPLKSDFRERARVNALRRLEPQPAISARTLETVFLGSEPKPNRQFPDCGGLSPNSLESLLRLFPAKKYFLHHSQRPKL